MITRLLPSLNLLNYILRIGTLKRGFSFKDKSLSSVLGLHVQSADYPKGGIKYSAGAGTFIPSLVFIHNLSNENENEIVKYKPGEWENKVKETYELCEALAIGYNSRSQSSTYNLDSNTLETVNSIYQQHYYELLPLTKNPTTRSLIKNTFIQHLKSQHPVEYAGMFVIPYEASIASSFTEFVETRMQTAWALGYLNNKQFITDEERINFIRYLANSFEKRFRDLLRYSPTMTESIFTSLQKVSELSVGQP